MGRMVAQLVDDIPAEVHQALSAVKEASVGVYVLETNP